MRFLVFALGFYIAALAMWDAYSYDGYYRRVVIAEASNKANRVQAEVLHLLDKIGI